MSTLGFLGLGTMGAPMAQRLVDAGHDVIVWNRSPEAVERLVAHGARAAATARDALAADVSFSMLANDEALLSVLDAEALSVLAGRTHVVMASISPDLADRLATDLARNGADYVAAPVLGRSNVAAEGRLNILAAEPPHPSTVSSPTSRRWAVASGVSASDRRSRTPSRLP